MHASFAFRDATVSTCGWGVYGFQSVHDHVYPAKPYALYGRGSSKQVEVPRTDHRPSRTRYTARRKIPQARGFRNS